MGDEILQVSVIVPVYNSAGCLQRCVDSLRDQLIQDYETILANDGSTDSSALICDEYSKRWSVSCYHQTRAMYALPHKLQVTRHFLVCAFVTKKKDANCLHTVQADKTVTHQKVAAASYPARER